VFFPKTLNHSHARIYPVTLLCLIPAIFLKGFIKTNQWLEYCCRQTVSVKKKTREIMPIGFLNDRPNRGF